MPTDAKRTRSNRARLPGLIVQLLISYVVIISLAVGFFVVPAQNAVWMLQTQSHEDQSTAVQRLSRSADSVLSLFSSISTAFLSDKSMFNIAFGLSKDINQDYYRVIAQIKQYNLLYGDIFSQMYVYVAHEHVVLGVSGLSDADTYYAAKLTPPLSKEGFAALFTGRAGREPVYWQEGQLVYVSHRLSFHTKEDRSVTVVYTLPIANFFNPSRYEQTPSRFGILLTASGVRLNSAQAEDLPVGALAAGLDGDTGVASLRLSDDSTLFAVRSQRSDRIYYFVMPRNAYNRRVTDLSRFLIASLVVFVLVSLLVIWLSVRRQYKPLKRLMLVIDSEKADSLTKRDYELILDCLSELKKERDGYKSLFIDESPRLRRLLLLSLLTESAPGEALAEASLRMLGIDLPHPYCMVVIADILDHAGMFFENAEASPLLGRFLIQNILTDLLPEEARAEYLEEDDSLIVLLNLPASGSPQASLNHIEDRLLFAADFLARELNLLCRFSASAMHLGKERFSEAYFEALECAHGIGPNERSVAVFGAVPAKAAQEFIYLQPFPEEQAQRLKAALRSGNEARAASIVRSVFAAAQECADLHPLLYKSVCRQLVSAFVDVLSEPPVASEPLNRKLWDLLDLDTRSMPARGVEERLLALCGEAAACVRTVGTDRQRRLLQDINAYVEEHFADPDLGVTRIAEVFSMSVSSLSAFYGHSGEMGLCKYINAVRVRRACALLTENADLSVEEAAARVGYTNVRTFSRVFSAEMKCPPGKYRADRQG